MHSSSMLKVPAGLIAAVLAVASLAPVAQAQNSTFAAKVDVPFAFETATGQHFAAGVYTISMNSQQIMLIQGQSNIGLAMTHLASDGQEATKGKAVFTHYGDKYFLRAVWVVGNSSHLIFARSKAEHQMQVAAVKTPTEVQLALLQIAR